CISVSVPSDQTEVNQTNLKPFVEYQVRVGASLQALNYSGKMQERLIRTYPLSAVAATVLPSGHLQIQWAEKVAAFQDSERVRLTVYDNSSENSDPIFQKTVEARGIVLDGIKFGGKYTIVFQEMTGSENSDTTTITA
ncbi:unnamed protein product, partial [Meganyctiphanes norvegica]